MNEREFRNLIRQQIIEKFDREVKSKLMIQGHEVTPISESNLREYIRKKLKDKFLFEQSENDDQGEVNDEALKSLEDLNSEVMSMAQAAAREAEKISKEKQGEQPKNEGVGLFIAGLALGIPGILNLAAKLARKIRAEINLIQWGSADAIAKQGDKVINVPTKEEGATLDKWAENTHHFYIKALSLPAVPFVGKERAKKFGVALYATLLAGIAIASLGTASVEAYHGLKTAVEGFGAAYEAAHGAHAGLEAAELAAPLRAALLALGEKTVAGVIKVGSASA